MDRGAWQATVHSVTQGQTQLKRLSLHTHTPVQSGGYPPHRSHCACWSRVGTHDILIQTVWESSVLQAPERPFSDLGSVYDRVIH